MFQKIYNYIAERIAAPVEVKHRGTNVETSYRDRTAYGMSYADWLGAYGDTGGGEKWRKGLSRNGQIKYVDHRLTRQNARNAYQESLTARRLVDGFADAVADAGLKLEPTPDAEKLGISEKAAEKWQSQVEESLDAWAASKTCNRSELDNFYQAHRQYQKFKGRDGEVFCRLFYSNRSDLLNPLQYEFIDPNQIEGDATTSTSGAYAIDDGIERDAAGREKHYKICWQTPNGEVKRKRIPAFGAKSKRRMMLHGFERDYPGQGRGISGLAGALEEFDLLLRYGGTQLDTAINQSSVVGFTKPSENVPASNPMQDMPAGPVEPTQVAQVEDTGSEFRLCRVDERINRVGGSIWLGNLEAGEDIKFPEATAPSIGYDKFVDAFTSYVSAAMSMPIEVLLMRFNQNYSASRATLVMFYRVVGIKIAQMDADFISPIYEMWLSGEIASGRVSAKGWLDPRMRRAWLKHNLVGAPMPSIDPLKSAKATRENLEMGLTDLDKASRDLNGSSGKDNRRKLKKQYSELPPSPFGGAASADLEAEDETD